MMVLCSQVSLDVFKLLNDSDVCIVTTTGSKIKDLIGKKVEKTEHLSSLANKIPCSKCCKKYYGKTSRGVAMWFKEYKADIRHLGTGSALVKPCG